MLIKIFNCNHNFWKFSKSIERFKNYVFLNVKFVLLSLDHQNILLQKVAHSGFLSGNETVFNFSKSSVQ